MSAFNHLMTTWQQAGNAATAATTTWHYSSLRGWMTKKVYQTKGSPIVWFVLDWLRCLL
jgi:hypothetical protein